MVCHMPPSWPKWSLSARMKSPTSSVFSMDSDGTRKACTTNVITKITTTSTLRNDCKPKKSRGTCGGGVPSSGTSPSDVIGGASSVCTGAAVSLASSCIISLLSWVCCGSVLCFGLPLAAQVFQRLSGRTLFGFLFGRAFGPSYKFGSVLALGKDAGFHRKGLAMVRPHFFHRCIDGLQPAAGLQQLLQGGLVVGQAEFTFVLRAHALQFRLKDLGNDEVARLLHAGIQVKSGDHSFNCIGEQG